MKRLIAALITAAVLAPAAHAETYEIRMVSESADGRQNVFEPAYLEIKAGDTVRFIPANKGHNSQSMKGMVPEGGSAWKSRLSKEYDITFDVPGIYGYRCTPHYAAGMVGVIVVDGDVSNLDAIRMAKASKRARDRFDSLLASIQ